MLEYIRNILKIRIHPNYHCIFKNITQKIKKRPVIFHYDSVKKIYYANERKNNHYFSEMKRGFSLYGKGLEKRSNSLSESYLLNKIEFDSDDIVIDCGANYSDLFLYLKNKIKSKNYISFEPGLLEYRCIIENAKGGENFNIGLGEEEGEKQFFVSSAGADSSFIEPLKYTGVLNIKLTTLDAMADRMNLNKVRLLKLEAEGFEPEILRGAEKFIQRCEFIAIDGGNERGKTQEETFSFQSNFLFDKGFVLVGVNLKWGRALFRNTVYK